MTTDLDIPWVERYRPQNFDDIVSQSVAIKNLKDFVNVGEKMPHMIFSGPAGTGKTSTALVIAKHMIQGDDYYQNVLELNASDTVRMGFVRKVIKDFVQQNLIIEDQPLKIVLLDEADNIPKTVQQALRRIIEKTAVRVKFIMMCNYINEIIDPIISRCAVFRFVQLPKEAIIERLEHIAEQEKLSIPEDKKQEFFETIFFISAGDLRKAINTLQMSVALELLDNLEVDEVLKISGFLDSKTLDKLITLLKQKQYMEAKELMEHVENFDSRNFIRQLILQLDELGLNNAQLSKIHASVGDVDYMISQGADESIQITSLLATIIDTLST